MKKIKLIVTMLLVGVFSLSSYAQDVKVPVSWVPPGLNNTSSTGLIQCGSINVTLNTAGSPHTPFGTSALIPDNVGATMVPITLTFSAPVYNLGILIGDLDEDAGGPSEWIQFTGVDLPTDVSPPSTGIPFILAGTIADPNGNDDTDAWVNWSSPVTSVTFNYNRANVMNFGLFIDSLRFDCDGTPTELNCCYGTDWQTLSWGDVPGAVGYQVEFGFNDATSSCCYDAVGIPFGVTENVTDNIFVVPESFEDCFWWRVRTEYADGSFSDWSEKICDCVEEEVIKCLPPVNLGCDIVSPAFERELNWDPVAGALGYELSITFNDLACCPVGSGPVETVTFNLTDAFYNITMPNACFSWKVRTICTEDPTYSEWSESKCSKDCSSSTARNDYNEGSFDFGSVPFSNVKVLLVPNPADDFVTVTMQGIGQEEMNKNTKVILTSTSGVQVFEGDITVNRSKEIALKSFAPGVYICTIVSGDELLHSSRLIVK